MRLPGILAVACVSLLGAANVASAQDENDWRGMRVGLLFGRSWSNISDPALSEVLVEGAGIQKTAKAGGHIGAYVRLPMTRAFSIQPEAHYVQKGARFRLSGEGALPGEDLEPLPSGAEFVIKLAYLEVPVLARFDFGVNPNQPGQSRFFLLGGPTFSLRGRCQFSLKASGFNFTVPCDGGDELGDEIEGSDPISKFDYGVVGGAGLAFRIVGFQTSLQARYGRGFASLASEGNNSSAKNSLISVLFGIEF